jgi:hypothetical protein
LSKGLFEIFKTLGKGREGERERYQEGPDKVR